MRLPAVVFALVAATGVAAADRQYTPDQIVIAGKLGAFVALARTCTGEPPMQAVTEQMTRVGLEMSDISGETAFRKRMDEQAAFVALTQSMAAEDGDSSTKIQNRACANVMRNFGPSGVVLPGLVQ